MKRFAFTLALLVLWLPVCHAQEAGPKMVLIQLEIFRISDRMTADTELSGNFWTDVAPGTDSTRTLFTQGAFQLAGQRLKATPKGWFWNDEPLCFDGKKISSGGDEIRLICDPRIFFKCGEKGAMAFRSVQKVEYFEKRPDGLFELKRLEPAVGIDFSATPVVQGAWVTGSEGSETKAARRRASRALPEPASIHLDDFEITLRSVARREPIPGVSLQVGRPVLETRQWRATLDLIPGNDYGVLLHPKEVQGVLIVHLRAELTTEEAIRKIEESQKKSEPRAK